MKSRRVFLTVIIVACMGAAALSQGVAINESNLPPSSAAILDVSSTTKGMLVPRMDSTQRVDMLIKANGLLVYDTDHDCFYYYVSTGSSSGYWQRLVADQQNHTLVDADGDSYLTLNYDGSDDDTLRIFFEDIEKYKITSRAIEMLNNSRSVILGEGAGQNMDLTGDKHNIYIGYHAGHANQNAGGNTAVGYNSLSENTQNSNTSESWLAGFYLPFLFL